MKQFSILILTCFLVSHTNAQTNMGFLTETGFVQDKIAKTEEHHYRIELDKSELLMLSVIQKDIDLTVGYVSPTGDERTVDGYNGKNGPEPLLIRADTSGTYVIKVDVFEDKGSGNYTLQVIDRQIKKPKLIDQLDQELEMWEELNYLPGCGVSLVDKDEIIYSKGFGKADKANNHKYESNTIQNIGSVSKTTIAISIMKLVEEGRLSLDTKINDILPFEVTNPFYPNSPITVRHLATHTSSINEMPAYAKSYVIVEPHQIKPDDVSKGEYRELVRTSRNKNLSMGDFLKNILTKDGSWYKKKKTFLKNKPGEQYRYSNVAATLAAYVVEQITEMSHAAYTKQIIFDPLGMNSTGWSFDDIDLERHAKLYFANGKTTMPRYTLITYPDGGLLTTTNDLSLYLQELIRGKAGRGTLLKSEFYAEMMRPQLEAKHFSNPREGDNAGIFWDINSSGDEGHSGGDPGIVTLMFFDTEKEVGGTIMSNSGLDDPLARKQFVEMWNIIGYYRGKLGEGL